MNDQRSSNSLTENQLTLIRALAQAKIQADSANSRLEDLKVRARTELPQGSIRAFEHVEVIITPGRVWDKAKARESWGDSICELQVSLDKAREQMDEDVFESFYRPSTTRVEVKIV